MKYTMLIYGNASEMPDFTPEQRQAGMHTLMMQVWATLRGRSYNWGIARQMNTSREPRNHPTGGCLQAQTALCLICDEQSLRKRC